MKHASSLSRHASANLHQSDLTSLDMFRLFWNTHGPVTVSWSGRHCHRHVDSGEEFYFKVWRPFHSIHSTRHVPYRFKDAAWRTSLRGAWRDRHRGRSSSCGPGTCRGSPGCPGSLWRHDLGAVPQGAMLPVNRFVKTDIVNTAPADLRQKSHVPRKYNPIQNHIAYCFSLQVDV